MTKYYSDHNFWYENWTHSSYQVGDEPYTWVHLVKVKLQYFKYCNGCCIAIPVQLLFWPCMLISISVVSCSWESRPSVIYTTYSSSTITATNPTAGILRPTSLTFSFYPFCLLLTVMSLFILKPTGDVIKIRYISSCFLSTALCMYPYCA